MSTAAIMNMQDVSLHGYVSREGLSSCFEPADARRQALSGLWPGRDMKPHELYEAVEKLQSVLCCDTCVGLTLSGMPGMRTTSGIFPALRV